MPQEMNPISKDGIYRVDCEICDSTGILTYDLSHTKYCEDAGVCIGRKFCPITKQINCGFCINGFIEFDYIFYRIAWRFTLSETHRARVKKTWRSTRVKIKQTITNHCKEEFSNNVPVECSMRENKIIISSLGWSKEHSFQMIMKYAAERGLDIHNFESVEIYDIRTFYGTKEPYGKTKHYQPAIYENYLRWMKSKEQNRE